MNSLHKAFKTIYHSYLFCDSKHLIHSSFGILVEYCKRCKRKNQNYFGRLNDDHNHMDPFRWQCTHQCLQNIKKFNAIVRTKSNVSRGVPRNFKRREPQFPVYTFPLKISVKTKKEKRSTRPQMSCKLFR